MEYNINMSMDDYNKYFHYGEPAPKKPSKVWRNVLIVGSIIITKVLIQHIGVF